MNRNTAGLEYVAPRRRPAAIPRRCARCGDPFHPHGTKKYCSPCSDAVVAERHARAKKSYPSSRVGGGTAGHTPTRQSGTSKHPLPEATEK